MKLIIQCAGRKNPIAGSFANVHFVAHPEFINKPGYYNPDDCIPNSQVTWREYVDQYNHRQGIFAVGIDNNPYKFLPAALLYKPQVYQHAINWFGIDNILILSAGWGLVKGEFYLPPYDITFSSTADKANRRKHHEIYKDFNHSYVLAGEETHVFCGKEYLPLLYKLTEDIKDKNIVIHHATDIEKHPGYSYIKYPRCFTNWQYQALEDFI